MSQKNAKVGASKPPQAANLTLKCKTMPKFIKVNCVQKDNSALELTLHTEYIMFFSKAKEGPESLEKTIISTMKGDIGVTETYDEVKALMGI